MRTATAAALGYRFAVECQDPALADYLGALLRPLRVGGEPDAVYAVDEHRRGQVEVSVDGVPVRQPSGPPDALNGLLWHVNRRAVEVSDDLLLVHAAAVALRGRALLLPAPMESGKSTLAAFLLRHGLDYVTDEAVALRGDGIVAPYPKWLSLDPGSWSLLPELAPFGGRDDPARRYVGDQWHVPVPPERVADPDGLAPALIVTPRYVPGSATTMTPLAQRDGVAVLAANSFNFRDAGAGGMAAVWAAAAGCRCAVLTFGDVSEAAATLAAALDEVVQAPTSSSP